MYISGVNFRLTPETKVMKLTFNSLTLLGTGTAEIGISGQSNKLGFLFSGNRIFSPDRRFIGAYNYGEPFDFEYTLNDTQYSYSINGKNINRNSSKSSYNIQRFYINTTGTYVSADAQFYCPNIESSLQFNDSFIALSPLSGGLTNSSQYQFRVFSGGLVFYSSNATPLTGIITGDVPSSSSLSILLTDTNTSRFDSDIRFLVNLDTSIGAISNIFDTSRVSGLDIIVSQISTDESGVLVNSLFDGSGNIGNTFTYVNSPANYLSSYNCASTNLRGESKAKSVVLKFEPISPQDGSSYKSEYVTGFSLTSGGQYLYPPLLKTTGYYSIPDLDWPLETILLSSGCSGDILVTFNNTNGTGAGASGLLKTSRVLLSGMFGESLNTYYLPQSYLPVSGGTGYLYSPKAILNTGNYSNCYDVAAKHASSYLLFNPFSGYGLIEPLAFYLTGEVLTAQTGINGTSGYTVTGIEFTNIGSGYNSNMFPKVSFYRQSGDTFSADAKGSFLMKQTGLYSFSNSWSIETGLTTFDLTGMTALTGTGFLSEVDNYFTSQINFSGLDSTEPIIAKLTVQLSGANSITQFITGIRSYDTSTGYLKKKNITTFSKLSSGSSLTFDLTQDELDTYYNSSEFINNGAAIELGDLDF